MIHCVRLIALYILIFLFDWSGGGSEIFYGRQHVLVNRYRVSVPQITMDMFHVVITIRFFPHSCDKSDMTGTPCGAETARFHPRFFVGLVLLDVKFSV